MDRATLFVYYILPMLVLLFGLVGNFFGKFMLVKRKALEKLGPKHMYMYLFSTDTLFLVQLIFTYISFNWPDYDPTVMSIYVCKIYLFISYATGPLSPYLIVYISVERFVVFKYPSRKSIMRSKRNQLIYLALIIVYNCLLYTPIPIFVEISSDNSTNQTGNIKQCAFSNPEIGMILNLIDIANRVLLPFILMIVSSVMLIFSIVRSSQRIAANLSLANQNKRLKRDIKISISLIFINIFYILLALPVSVLANSPISSIDYVITIYMLYIAYGINFYLILFTNSLVSNEFFQMVEKPFGCKFK